MRDPYHLDALLRLGALLERAVQPQQARFAYERVLHFDPRNETARGALDRTRTVRA
jgi:hypothetical protein